MSRRLAIAVVVVVAVYAIAITVVLWRVESASQDLKADVAKQLDEMRREQRDRHYDLRQMILLGCSGALQSAPKRSEIIVAPHKEESAP